jgi:hypothetical protein
MSYISDNRNYTIYKLTNFTVYSCLREEGWDGQGM